MLKTPFKRTSALALFFAVSLWLIPTVPADTFSDADWVSLNQGGWGETDAVDAIAAGGSGKLYVGGQFNFAAGSIWDIAEWDGRAWSALGSGIGPYILALAVSGTNLYAGGYFTTGGGVPANHNIAKWDGSAWSVLGSGMNSNIVALAVSGNDLYAAGEFTTADGVPANYIARWDGSAWSALGSGMNSNVYALAVSGTSLYAGGAFTTAGGVPAMRVAKWNGNAWSALASGVNGRVWALAARGTDLYAGGSLAASAPGAGCVAKWNGVAWSALGSGIGGEYSTVYALAASGTNLYAGGIFSTAGGIPANCVAKWDGNAWSALGSGVTGGLYGSVVYALAADAFGHLFVGGVFSYAGTNWSPGIAQANVGSGVAGGRFGGWAYSPITGFSCTFREATIGQPYRIQASPSLATGSWSDVTNFTYSNPIVITDLAERGSTSRFYRAVTP